MRAPFTVFLPVVVGRRARWELGRGLKVELQPDLVGDAGDEGDLWDADVPVGIGDVGSRRPLDLTGPDRRHDRVEDDVASDVADGELTGDLDGIGLTGHGGLGKPDDPAGRKGDVLVR